MSFISRSYVRDAKGQQCCPFFRSELECEENIMLVSRVKREKPPRSQRLRWVLWLSDHSAER